MHCASGKTSPVFVFFAFFFGGGGGGITKARCLALVFALKQAVFACFVYRRKHGTVETGGLHNWRKVCSPCRMCAAIVLTMPGA